MTPDGRSRQRLLAAAAWLAAGAALVLLGVIAYEAVFSHLPFQDDDGYVIVSLRNFYAGRDLYGDVYSQYGPGLFVFVGGLIDLLGIPLTTDGARFANLFLWLASTALAGLVLLRLTKNVAIAVVGAAVTFLLLGVNAAEPLHPGASIGLLLLFLVAAAAFVEDRPKLGLALIGACAAALLTIKVNVGAFAFVSLACAAVFTAPSVRRLQPLPVLTGAALVALPFLLLEAHLDDGDTFRYALITACSCAGLAVVALAAPPDRRLPVDRLAWFGLGAGVVIALAAIVPLAAGTTPGELVDGWFVRPSRTPDVQFVAVPWFGRPPAGWEVLGLVAAIVTAVCMRRGVRLPLRARALVGLGRMLIGFAAWLVLSDPITDSTFEFPFGLDYAVAIATPFAWLIVAVPDDRLGIPRFLRVLIALVAVLQVLHGYPVPGSQFGWGQLLLVIVAGICIADGVADLAAARAALPGPERIWAIAGLAAVVVFGAYVLFAPLKRYDSVIRSGYDAGVPLDLPGAERMRVAEPVADQLHSIVAAIDDRCDSFITLPGLNSLYLFTGRDAPTVLSGPWPFFLTSEDQAKLVDRFDDDESLCVVERQDTLQFWAAFSRGVVPQRPLVQFIEREFEPALTENGYVLAVRRSGDDSPDD